MGLYEQQLRIRAAELIRGAQGLRSSEWPVQGITLESPLQLVSQLQQQLTSGTPVTAAIALSSVNNWASAVNSVSPADGELGFELTVPVCQPRSLYQCMYSV